jgi:hypothetical protein
MTNELIVCLTFTNRCLAKDRKSQRVQITSPLEGRVFWVLICTWLWPIMVITGLNTAWVLSKRKKQALKTSNPV